MIRKSGNGFLQGTGSAPIPVLIPAFREFPGSARGRKLFTAKKKLEDRFGLAIEHFAYPFGDYDAAVVDLVREAGFKTAGTMDRGVNGDGIDPFRLRRWTARYPTRTLGSLIRRIFG